MTAPEDGDQTKRLGGCAVDSHPPGEVEHSDPVFELSCGCPCHQLDRDAVVAAVAYRLQARWEPRHAFVVNATVQVMRSGEWRDFSPSPDGSNGGSDG